EGRAEQAAERHRLLGEAADPQVDGVDAGGGCASRRITTVYAGAVQEGEAVGLIGSKRPLRSPGAGIDDGASTQHEGCRDRALFDKRIDVSCYQGAMGSVGGDEVDERFRVPQVLDEVCPARVGLELAVA